MPFLKIITRVPFSRQEAGIGVDELRVPVFSGLQPEHFSDAHLMLPTLVPEIR